MVRHSPWARVHAGSNPAARTKRSLALSQDWYQDVKDFHQEVCERETPAFPTNANCSVALLRINLISEEIKETLNALGHGNLVELADGICDSIVVLLGTAIDYGIDIRPIWDEVHRTNILKKGGPRREDGKLLKPVGWSGPRVKELIQEQVEKGKSDAT